MGCEDCLAAGDGDSDICSLGAISGGGGGGGDGLGTGIGGTGWARRLGASSCPLLVMEFGLLWEVSASVVAE